VYANFEETNDGASNANVCRNLLEWYNEYQAEELRAKINIVKRNRYRLERPEILSYGA
jgi:hypothetical protein